MKRSQSILCASAAAAVALAVCASSFGASEPPSRSMPIAGGPEYVRVRVCPANLSFEQFVRHSSHVAIGEVLAVRPVAAREGFDYTATSFAVQRWVKGVGPETIELRVGGAILPERETVVDGAPSFAAGEPCILFLQEMPGEDAFGIVGLERGVNRIVRNAEGGERVRGRFALDELPEAFLDRIETVLAEEN